MIKTIPVSEARQNLPELVSRIKRLIDRVVITRKGRPEVVMMSFDEYESWVETLEIMSDPTTVKGIKEGLKDLKAGRFKSFEEVLKNQHVRKKKR